MGDVTDLTMIPLDDIKAAKKVLEEHDIFRTPLVPLNLEVPNKKIYLKLENLQPVKSFKIRGACNAMSRLSQEQLRHGVYTASAGNFAQGVAWTANKRNIPCTIIVPDTAPDIKIRAIKSLHVDAVIQKVPYDVWWNIMVFEHDPDVKGTFLHPVVDKHVISGNGTIGLEILEDLPSIDTLICPWGGGGHCTGIASAIKSIKPEANVIACEVETGAPLTASLKAGKPSSVVNHRQSFVDGMNGKALFPEMWNLARSLVDGTVVLSADDIGKAVKLLVERNALVAEGAGAAPVAAALTDQIPDGNIVCVVSGGNIDTKVLVELLQGNKLE